MSGSGDKTEKATPKKRHDERKKGNVFQSQDIINVVSILAVFTVLKIYLPYMFKHLGNTMAKYILWIKYTDTINESLAMDILKDGCVTIILVACPILLTAAAAVIITSGAQTRFVFSKENIKMKFSKLNPIQGFKRLVSMRSAVELIKSLLKVIIISYVLYSAFKNIINSFSALISMNIMQGILFILNSIMDIVLKVAVVFAILSAFDYLYQWYDYEKNIRMSKQELKEEYKHTEGDPQIKGKIKDLQRQMAARRMMKQVPSADVIVKNPTHFAVALKYDAKYNRAPVVVAKGQDYMALKILQISQQYHIPVKENKPLAQALYRSVDINKEIPPELYAAIAEILAWVFTLKQGGKQVL